MSLDRSQFVFPADEVIEPPCLCLYCNVFTKEQRVEYRRLCDAKRDVLLGAGYSLGNAAEGARGEAAFSILFNRPVDLNVYDCGDGGIDFVIRDGYVSLATTSRPSEKVRDLIGYERSAPRVGN
jgi:hypothetical protein